MADTPRDVAGASYGYYKRHNSTESGRGRGMQREQREKGSDRLGKRQPKFADRYNYLSKGSTTKGGCNLKDFKEQELLHDHILGELQAAGDIVALDVREHVMMLYRKLREGVFASERVDGFAVIGIRNGRKFT